MRRMAQTVVEIHVPLRATPGLPEHSYQYPWIDDVEEHLAEQDDVEVFDDGEEVDDVYIFFITGGSESALLDAASRLATLERVPAGAFAVVTDEDAEEFGQGRRVTLPMS